MRNSLNNFEAVFGMTAIALILAAVPLTARAELLGGGDGTPPVVKQISFAEFKDRCANPEKYPDIQVAPQHTVFQCQSNETDWVTDQPGSIPLPSERTVQGDVISDKFAVAVDNEQIAIPNKGGSCLRFKQVTRAISLEIPMSCNDIQKYDSAVQYCQIATDSAEGANPKLITTKDTGQVVDTCAGVGAPTAPPQK